VWTTSFGVKLERKAKMKDKTYLIRRKDGRQVRLTELASCAG